MVASDENEFVAIGEDARRQCRLYDSEGPPLIEGPLAFTVDR